MNIDEKRERLIKFCNDNDSCTICPLNKFGYCKNKIWDDFTKNEIDKCYNLAFCNEQPKEEINHPDRYAGGKYECIKVMVDVFGADAVKHFCILNAFKYIWRAEKKNGIEDIKKAVWYLNKYIELGGEEE